MRLIGKSRLLRLSSDGDARVSGASRALNAELMEGQWRTPQDALSAYPRAELEGHRLVIPLDARHCVVVAINYELGIALIEYAGLRQERTDHSRTKGRGRE